MSQVYGNTAKSNIFTFTVNICISSFLAPETEQLAKTT